MNYDIHVLLLMECFALLIFKWCLGSLEHLNKELMIYVYVCMACFNLHEAEGTLEGLPYDLSFIL